MTKRARRGSNITSGRSHPEARVLRIEAIRRDGGTQHRLGSHTQTVREYAALMAEGVEFPPVRVWSDGCNYWLTDGFRRIAATELAGLVEIRAEVFFGTKEDAQWDSYAANSVHGMRRSTAEAVNVLKCALQHPRASTLSNIQIAKHLNIPQTTVRRWRARLGSPHDDDGVRVVTRGNNTYELRTKNIGRDTGGRRRRPKSLKQLRVGLEEMKVQACPGARRLLNVFGNWAFGTGAESDCLAAIEGILQSAEREVACVGMSQPCG